MQFVLLHLIVFFFFFQAEDGIRDGHVTGVQTCALPISTARGRSVPARSGSPSSAVPRRAADFRTGRPRRCCTLPEAVPSSPPQPSPHRHSRPDRRSEERRVGKKCRSRSSTDHEEKNKEK